MDTIMGRELKRVPLDFNAPLNKIWKGYINPHYKPCPQENKTCFGGHTAAAKWLDAIVRLLMLAGEEASESHRADEMKARGRTYPHPYLQEWSQAPRFSIPREINDQALERDHYSDRLGVVGRYLRDNPLKLLPLTSELANLTAGLAGNKPDVIGYDSRSTWLVTKKLRDMAGLEDKWGVCTVCDGECSDPLIREVYNNWVPEEPPVGDAFQLWETTSEGSPTSPVFKSLDMLCEWCQNNATTFGSNRASKSEWMSMLSNGLVVHREGNAMFI